MNIFNRVRFGCFNPGGGGGGAAGPYLPTAGGTMTGAITLPGDPTSALQAADKNYTDNGDAATLSASETFTNAQILADTITGPFVQAANPANITTGNVQVTIPGLGLVKFMTTLG